MIDVDTGVDDAQAIMLALSSPDIEVMAITCVAGNVVIDKVCRNTLKVLKICGRLDVSIIEPPHDKTDKMACVPSEDSDQPGHPPSLIRVFAVHMKKPWVLSYPLSAQRRLWSDWAGAQADLSLRWAHMPF